MGRCADLKNAALSEVEGWRWAEAKNKDKRTKSQEPRTKIKIALSQNLRRSAALRYTRDIWGRKNYGCRWGDVPIWKFVDAALGSP